MSSLCITRGLVTAAGCIRGWSCCSSFSLAILLWVSYTLHMQIDSLAQWADTAKSLSERGYVRWQTQFDIDNPNGFVAGFMVLDDSAPRVRLVTFNADVRDAIMRYKD